jgi:hypothetical protein
MKFEHAPEVKKIADELIKKYHQHLIACRIEYVFSDSTPMKSGKEVWGTMRKITSLGAFLATPSSPAEAGKEVDEEGNPILPNNDPFFCCTISKPVWEILDTANKIALVDHELSHAGTEEQEDGSYKLVIIPHDLEEFTSIVERHGMWQNSVAVFVERAKKHTKSAEIEEICDNVNGE